jgi:hypothetical protein
MATVEITVDDNKIQDLLQSDQGLAALPGPILNQMLQAEMTEHLQAARRAQRKQTRCLDDDPLHLRPLPMSRATKRSRPG